MDVKVFKVGMRVGTRDAVIPCEKGYGFNTKPILEAVNIAVAQAYKKIRKDMVVA